MKRIIQILPAFLITLSFSGCALVRVTELALGPKSLTIEPNKIVFCGIQDDTLRLDIPLTLNNHSKGNASITQIAITTSIADQYIVASSKHESINIEPGAECSLLFPVDISLSNIPEGILAGIPAFRFTIEAHVDFGMLGERVLSFETERKIFSPTKSRLSLKSISLANSNLAAFRLNMVFTHTDNPNNKLTNASLSGSALINGIPIGTLKQISDGDEIETEVVIPTVTAMILTRNVTSKKRCSVKMNVLYEADTKLMKYRIPYTFESDIASFQGKNAIEETIQENSF